MPPRERSTTDRPGIYNIVDDGGSVSNAPRSQELGWQPGSW